MERRPAIATRDLNQFLSRCVQPLSGRTALVPRRRITYKTLLTSEGLRSPDSRRICHINEGVAKDLMLGVVQRQLPGLIGRAGKVAVR